jgi:hypothetical protein
MGGASDFILPALGAAAGFALAIPTGGLSLGMTAAEIGTLAGATALGGIGGSMMGSAMNPQMPEYTQYGQNWQNQMPINYGPSAEEMAYYQAQQNALEQQRADTAAAQAEADQQKADAEAKQKRRTAQAAAGRRRTNPTGSQGLLGEPDVKKSGLLGE